MLPPPIFSRRGATYDAELHAGREANQRYQEIWRPDRRRQPEPRHQERRDIGPPRPERLGQIHQHEDDARPHPAHVRHRQRPRLRRI